VFPNPTAANQCPGANTQDVGAAIHWAINNGANVISMSLGGAHPDTMFEEPAVSDAIAAGVVVVAAAGNDGKAQLDYPAADPHVIAAGASSLDDSANPRNYGAAVERVASYSNYITNAGAGEYYVVAPGGDPNAAQGNCTQRSCIDFLQWITNLYSNTAFSNAGEVVLIAGTSMSTPHIAGLAALMLDKDPGLTPDQVATIISTNTVDIGDPKQGHGRVDAVQALNATP
jgi:subtilisin family serine protease